MKEPKILILRMRKLTFRDLLRDYCMKCGWGFTDAILDREYVPVDEVVDLVEPLIWLYRRRNSLTDKEEDAKIAELETQLIGALKLTFEKFSEKRKD